MTFQNHPAYRLPLEKQLFYVTPSKPVPGHTLIAKRVVLLPRPRSISPPQPGRGRSSSREPLPAGRGEALAKLPSLSARLYLLLIHSSCQDKLFLSSSQKGVGAAWAQAVLPLSGNAQEGSLPCRRIFSPFEARRGFVLVFLTRFIYYLQHKYLYVYYRRYNTMMYL